MQLSRKYRVAAPRSEVYAALLDPAVLCRLIDVCEKIVPTGAESYEAHLRISLAGFKKVSRLQMQMTERHPDRSFVLLFEGGGFSGSVKGRAEIHLTESRGQSEIRCDADLQVGGLLAAIGAPRMEAGASRMMDEFFAKFAKQMAGA